MGTEVGAISALDGLLRHLPVFLQVVSIVVIIGVAAYGWRVITRLAKQCETDNRRRFCVEDMRGDAR